MFNAHWVRVCTTEKLTKQERQGYSRLLTQNPDLLKQQGSLTDMGKVSVEGVWLNQTEWTECDKHAYSPSYLLREQDYHLSPGV